MRLKYCETVHRGTGSTRGPARADAQRRSPQASPDDLESVGQRREPECSVVRRDDERFRERLAPELRGREMDRVEDAERGGHRLRSSPKNWRRDVDDLQGLDDSEDGRSADRQCFAVDLRMSYA